MPADCRRVHVRARIEEIEHVCSAPCAYGAHQRRVVRSRADFQIIGGLRQRAQRWGRARLARLVGREVGAMAGVVLV